MLRPESGRMSSGVADLVALIWAVGGGLLAPGVAIARGLRLGRGLFERWLIGLALGRILFGVATLILTTAGIGAWMVAWAPLAVAAWGLVVWRGPAPDPTEWREELRTLAPALGVAGFAAALLVHATIGRSALPDALGRMVFFGRDTTIDPLTHVAASLQILDTGLPMNLMHVAGTEFTNSYLPFAERVGVALVSGLSMLDLTFRILPFLELFALGATAAVLTGALGGGRLARAGAALLVLLGSGAPFLIEAAGALFGTRPAGLDSWTFFGPYVLSFNSVTPAVQTAMVALLLLRRLEPGMRHHAVVAGALVAALFELKLFVWAPVFGALVLVAGGGTPLRSRRALRLTAASAMLFVLPSLVEKAWWAARLAGAESRQGFGLCLGCIPRYFAEAAMGPDLPPFDVFDRFENLSLLQDPGLLLVTLTATLVMFVVGLGARLVALPELLRESRTPGDAAEPGRTTVHRIVLVAAVLGWLAMLVVKNAPHHLNVTQFAWIASFGLWPFVARVLGRWVVERRWLPAVLVAFVALVSTLPVVGRLGYGAPPMAAVSRDEVDLMQRLRTLSEPEDVVLEPSVLQHALFPSPVTWVAGRSVHITSRPAIAALDAADVRARLTRVEAVFARADRQAALRAIAESGASWVYAPRATPLRFSPGSALEVALQNAAGIVYRVGDLPTRVP